MCWSNLQLELVQQAWPLKGLMQCQNLWLRGHPSLLASTIWQKLNFFPLTIRFSFSLYWIHLWGRNEMWDVNETFSLEGRRVPGQRRGWSWSEPMTSLPIFPPSIFLSLLSLAVTLGGMWRADWNQQRVMAVISQKDIKHAETSVSNRPLTALRWRSRWGEMRGRLGLGGAAVQLKCLLQASQRPREDKIKSIRLSPSSSCFSDSQATGTPYVRWSLRACVSDLMRRCVQVCGIWGNYQQR